MEIEIDRIFFYLWIITLIDEIPFKKVPLIGHPESRIGPFTTEASRYLLNSLYFVEGIVRL